MHAFCQLSHSKSNLFRPNFCETMPSREMAERENVLGRLVIVTITSVFKRHRRAEAKSRSGRRADPFEVTSQGLQNEIK